MLDYKTGYTPGANHYLDGTALQPLPSPAFNHGVRHVRVNVNPGNEAAPEAVTPKATL